MVYSEDEVTPGSALRPDNKRKHHILYISFMELEALSSTDAWFPIAILRSDICKSVTGGFSHAIGELLEHLFTSADSLETAGFIVDHSGGASVVTCTLSIKNAV